MNDRLEQLRRQQEEQEINAVTTYFSSKMSGKNAYILAIQNHQITAEEYEAGTGESVAETLAQQYALGLYQLVVAARRRLNAGLMTQEQMEAIPGMPEDPLHLDLAEMMTQTKVAVVAAKADVPVEAVEVVNQPALDAEEAKAEEPVRVEAVRRPDDKVKADEADTPAGDPAADEADAPTAATAEQGEVATNG